MSFYAIAFYDAMVGDKMQHYLQTARLSQMLQYVRVFVHWWTNIQYEVLLAKAAVIWVSYSPWTLFPSIHFFLRKERQLVHNKEVSMKSTRLSMDFPISTGQRTNSYRLSGFCEFIKTSFPDVKTQNSDVVVEKKNHSTQGTQFSWKTLCLLKA